MKSSFAAAAMTALAARQVAGHAMFQQLWVEGTDYISLSSFDHSIRASPG
jgi:cellulase